MTLLAVWVVALALITGHRQDIPLSMMALATLFFIVLIPSMNDLVHSIERRMGGDADGER